MEVKVVEATADWYKIAFKDPGSGQQLVISLSGAIAAQWGLHTDQMIPTATTLADEIFFNHDLSKPFKSEYMFTPINSQPTLHETVDSIRQNSI